MGNYNYRLNQIIEAINRSSMRMVTLPQGSEVATITDNSNNNDDLESMKHMIIMMKEKVLILMMTMQLRKLDQ